MPALGLVGRGPAISTPSFKDHLPDCITTDVFPNPWLDRVENAYALAFAAGVACDSGLAYETLRSSRRDPRSLANAVYARRVARMYNEPANSRIGQIASAALPMKLTAEIRPSGVDG